jgi:hypothetical protein
VIGGGPAGLKVAEIAAKRGHQVTLLERQRQLGGQVLLAAVQPEHAVVGEVVSYLETQLVEAQVDIRLGVAATPANVAALRPDVIVLANGSEPNLPGRADDGGVEARRLGRQVLPGIDGLEQRFVVSADEVLSGVVKPSGKVLVIDETGHWEAAGTVEFLADSGCSVEVIASHGAIGAELEGGARTLFQRRAAIKRIRLSPNSVVGEIAKGRVRVSAVFSSGDDAGWGKYVLIPGDDRWIEDVDWVVAVIGRRSREDPQTQICARAFGRAHRARRRLRGAASSSKRDPGGLHSRGGFVAQTGRRTEMGVSASATAEIGGTCEADQHKVVLVADRVSKAFPGVLALDEVSLEVRSGEVNALVGENGARKSTLIKRMAAFYAPDSGEIRIGGQLLRPDPAAAHEAGIATIHQDHHLIPSMTVAENLLLGRWPTRFGVLSRASMLRQAEARAGPGRPKPVAAQTRAPAFARRKPAGRDRPRASRKLACPNHG